MLLTIMMMHPWMDFMLPKLMTSMLIIMLMMILLIDVGLISARFNYLAHAKPGHISKPA